MKRIIYIALFVAFFASCDKLSEAPETAGENVLLTKASSRDETTSATKDYAVSLSDIQNYVRYKTEAAQEEGKDLVVKDIAPLFEDQRSGFTPLYLINYEDGWEVISGDKRTPPVVASNETGYLDLSKQGNGGLVDGILVWLDGEASTITSLHSLHDGDSLPSDAQNNYKTWQTINGESSRLETESGNTRLIIPDTPDPRGHWEVNVSRSESLASEYILSTATWKESNFYPLTDYLDATPLTPLSLTTGRMLYYLYNNKWSVSQTAPTDSINFPTITWGNLSTTYNSNVRTFINALCKGLYSPPSPDYTPDFPNTRRNDGTRLQHPSAELVEEAIGLFSLYRVSCSVTDYDGSAPYTSIVQNSIPVMVSAWGNHFIGYSNGRVFLIDKYRIYNVTTIYSFVWVWDIEPDPEEQIDIIVEPDPVYGYSIGGKYAMNWGFEYDTGAQTDGDNIWFTDTDGWTVFGTSYQYKREMLTSYQQAN